MSPSFLSGFGKLCPHLAIDFDRLWGLAPRALGLAFAFVLVTTSPNSWANEGPAMSQPKASTHLVLGPQAAALLTDSEWDSEIGVEVHLTRLRDSPLLSVVGAGFGVATFSRGDIVQLSFDVYVGTRVIADVPIGVSVGPVLKAFENGRPQVGGRSTLWLYHGVMPYVSASWLTGPMSPAQPGLEIGVKIPFSLRDW